MTANQAMAQKKFLSTQSYDNLFFEKYNASFGFEFEFFEVQLNSRTVLIENTAIVCVL
jgi:D-lactate dehydrogenase